MIVFRSKQWVLDRIVVEMSLYGFDRFQKAPNGRIGCPDVGSIAVTSGSAILSYRNTDSHFVAAKELRIYQTDTIRLWSVPSQSAYVCVPVASSERVLPNHNDPSELIVIYI